MTVVAYGDWQTTPPEGGWVQVWPVESPAPFVVPVWYDRPPLVGGVSTDTGRDAWVLAPPSDQWPEGWRWRRLISTTGGTR